MLAQKIFENAQKSAAEHSAILDAMSMRFSASWGQGALAATSAARRTLLRHLDAGGLLRVTMVHKGIYFCPGPYPEHRHIWAEFVADFKALSLDVHVGKCVLVKRKGGHSCFSTKLFLCPADDACTVETGSETLVDMLGEAGMDLSNGSHEAALTEVPDHPIAA